MHKLDSFFGKLDTQSDAFCGYMPPKHDAQQMADDLFAFLFPISCQGRRSAFVQYVDLRERMSRLLAPLELEKDPLAEADRYLHGLPAIYEQLIEDAQASYRFDPAAESIEEVISTYPGFFAITVYRLAHALAVQGVPLLPRMFTEHAHARTGIDIHPAAEIGHSLFIDHGTGIVIGATSVIGNNVKLYQGVTLGALQVEKALAQTKRHPTVEDNVIIYANATILGGSTVIGHDSILGGNVFLTESVPPFSTVYHKSQVSIRNQGVHSDLVNFVI